MSEILITQPDRGRTVEANQGDVIVIRLEENLTTGYEWKIGTINRSIFELLSSDYSSTSGTSMGRGGIRTVRLRAKSSGSEQIQLGLRRSWDSVDSAIERFEVNIKVQ